MNLLNAYNLLKESDNNYDILSDKTFDGVKNKIKIEILKYKNDLNPAIKIYSLNDPNKCGLVHYDNKLSAIRAYNSLTDLVKVLEYMSNYINNADSFDWYNIIKDEDIDLIKQNVTTTEPSNIGGMESSTPGGVLEEPGVTPPTPIELPPEEKYPPAPLEEVPKEEGTI